MRAHADKCSLDYQLGTRPAHWARQRELFERVAGSIPWRRASTRATASAWLTVVAPNTLPASFLHKVLRLVAAHSLDVKLAEMDTVEDCLILRVLVTGSANWDRRRGGRGAPQVARRDGARAALRQGRADGAGRDVARGKIRARDAGAAHAGHVAR